MTLTQKQQNKVKYGGAVYDIDRSHHNILDIFDWLLTGELDEFDQGLMLVTKLFGERAPYEQALVDLGVKLLSLGKDAKGSKVPSKRDMDFKQDYPIYRADILREYGIDIAKDNIDFDTLWMLLENLSVKSRFNEVRGIRNKNLSEIKDLKERVEYKKAQEYYKLDDIVTIVGEELDTKQQDDKAFKELLSQFI